MRRLIGVIALCLLTFPALCQSKSKYQVATITEVKPHQGAGDGTPDATSYDVSVKVDDTIYVVQYTPPLGMITVLRDGTRANCANDPPSCTSDTSDGGEGIEW